MTPILIIGFSLILYGCMSHILHSWQRTVTFWSGLGSIALVCIGVILMAGTST